MENLNYTEHLYVLKTEVVNKVYELFITSLFDVELTIEPDYDFVTKDGSPDYFECVEDLSQCFNLEYSENEGFQITVVHSSLDSLVMKILNSPDNPLKDAIFEKQVMDAISEAVQNIADSLCLSYKTCFGDLASDMEDLSLQIHRQLK